MKVKCVKHVQCSYCKGKKKVEEWSHVTGNYLATCRLCEAKGEVPVEVLLTFKEFAQELMRDEIRAKDMWSQPFGKDEAVKDE